MKRLSVFSLIAVAALLTACHSVGIAPVSSKGSKAVTTSHSGYSHNSAQVGSDGLVSSTVQIRSATTQGTVQTTGNMVQTAESSPYLAAQHQGSPANGVVHTTDSVRGSAMYVGSTSGGIFQTTTGIVFGAAK